MARNQLNLNRYRKIYPQLRKSPYYWVRDTHIREVKELQMSSGVVTFTTGVTLNSPIVIATAKGTDSNVNVWVYNTIGTPGSTWQIQIAASDTSYDGFVHVVVAEGNP